MLLLLLRVPETDGGPVVPPPGEGEGTRVLTFSTAILNRRSFSTGTAIRKSFSLEG